MGIPEKAVASGNELLQYIPQRAPIVMVDKFYGNNGEMTCAGLEIKPDNIFIEDGKLNESGILEHIAQTCALRAGYNCKQANIPVPLGYIGGVKKLKYLQLPSVGDELYTTIKIEQEVFDITLVNAEVKCNGNIIATCELKIFLDKQEAANIA